MAEATRREGCLAVTEPRDEPGGGGGRVELIQEVQGKATEARSQFFDETDSTN